jgi:ABC-type transport system substrate-binding protein
VVVPVVLDWQTVCAQRGDVHPERCPVCGQLLVCTGVIPRGGAYPPGWEPDSILYGSYAPDSLRNTSHVNDLKLTAMLKEQRRTEDLAARKQLIFDIQRYEAEQQYYVYLGCATQTGPYQPYVKNYAPNSLEEYGMAAAVLWLER